jgi:Methyltransferase domain
MTRDELISEAYVEEQRRLHAAPRGYGQRGSKWSPQVEEMLRRHSCRSMLDYGCGQGSLVRVLTNNFRLAHPVDFREYDPAIPGKDAPPEEPADLVVCTDVLEHVESEKIVRVMRHLSELTRRALFAVIALVPTEKRLSDGRQAHILIRSVEWWKYQFEDYGFVLSQSIPSANPKKAHKQFAAVWVRVKG